MSLCFKYIKLLTDQFGMDLEDMSLFINDMLVIFSHVSLFSGPLRYSGSSKCHQQASHSAYVRSHPKDQYGVPVLLHPAPVAHPHPPGLPQHVLH